MSEIAVSNCKAAVSNCKLNGSKLNASFCHENGFNYVDKGVFMCTKFKDSICRSCKVECNNNLRGKIVDKHNNTLVLPPKPIVYSEQSIEGPGLNDGTIVSLYYTNKWNVASNTGYDVSTFHWFGDMTFAEIINDLITRLYPEYKVSIKDGSLVLPINKTYCHTIGFKHYNFHPHRGSPEKIWNVQTSCNGVIVEDELKFKSIDEKLYGTIVNCGTYNLVYESPLMKYIKANIYDYDMKSFIRSKDKLKFIIMGGIIIAHNTKSSLFINTFPQYKQIYDIYPKFVKNLASNISKHNQKQEINPDKLKVVSMFDFKTSNIELVIELLGNTNNAELFAGLMERMGLKF